MSQKQVSWVRPFVLSVTLLGLGGFTYWLEFKHKPEQENAEEAQKKVLAVKDAAVESILLDGGTSATTYMLACQESKLCKPGENSKWKLLEPIQAKADDSNANSLLSTLNNLAVPESIDLKDETPEKRASLLKDYGLSPEQRAAATERKIVLKTSKGETTMFFGGVHPITNNLFAIVQNGAKLNDTTVYMIPQYFKANLERDLTYWRDKKILAVNSSDITSFEIEKAGSPKVTAERKGQDWILDGGYTGDHENIEGLLNSLAYATATKFISDSQTDAAAKAALKGSKIYLKFSFVTKGEPTVITLYEKPSLDQKGKKEDERKWLLFATVSNADPLYEMQNGFKNQLGKSLKDLRLSKLITSMERFGAKRLEFSGKAIGDKPLILVASNDKWLTEPEKTEVSNERVQGMLDRLSGNRIRDFLEGKDILPGQENGLTVRLSDEKGEKKRNLVFWKNGKNLYARDLDSKRNEAYIVDPAIEGGLPWNRDYFNKTNAKK